MELNAAAIAYAATSGDLGESMRALSKIKSTRQEGTPEEKESMRRALEPYLVATPTNAMNAATALLELADPKAIDAITKAMEKKWSVPLHEDVAEALATVREKLHQLRDAKSAEDAIKRLDEEANPVPLSSKESAKAAQKMVDDLFPKNTEKKKPKSKNR